MLFYLPLMESIKAISPGTVQRISERRSERWRGFQMYNVTRVSVCVCVCVGARPFYVMVNSTTLNPEPAKPQRQHKRKPKEIEELIKDC